MTSLQISVSFFFVFLVLLFPPLVTCNGESGVCVPFRLQGRHSGYSGFNLSCNISNKTVSKLPPSEFQNIHYDSRVIQIYDSDNGLPRSLLNLSLFGSGWNKNCTILNCSSTSVDLNNISTLYVRIQCLSTRRIQPLNSSCEFIATVSVPVVNTSCRIDDFLHLRWSPTPADDTSPGTIGRTIMLVFLGICTGFPVLIFFVCCYCPRVVRSYRGYDHGLFVAILPHSNDRLRFFSLGHHPSDTASREQPFKAGLDNSIIESYPRILLDEKLLLPNPNDTVCSICMSEYQPTETLKIIPSCNHYFHVKCINQWLSMSSTCPICRESQDLQSLLPSDVAP